MLRTMIYKFILFLLVFLIIYKPEFVFIPHSINTFFGAIGLLFFLFGHEDRRRILSHIEIRGKDFIRICIPFMLVAVVAIVVNFSFDMRYVKYAVPLFFSFWGAYLIAVISYRAYGRFDADIFIKYLLAGGLVYVLVSLLMFFSPPLNTLLTSMLRMDEVMVDAFMRTSGFRIIGFGATFFTSGVVTGFVLIMLAAYIVTHELSYRQQIFYYFSYIFITIVGMMMARTALVGAGIGLAMIGLSLVKKPKDLIKTIFLVLLVLAGIFYIITRFFSDFAAELETLFEFAFEMFFNLSDSGSMSTGSTDTLMTMWDIVPRTFKSWIIGDAKWNGAYGYYMNTDVGYLRNIWYFGIIGMAALTYYYYKTLKIVFIDRNPGLPNSRMLGLILFAYVMILNMKGPADMFFYVIPLYFCSPVAEDLPDETEMITTETNEESTR